MNREHFDYLMEKFGFVVNPNNSDAGMYDNVVVVIYEPRKDRILVYCYGQGFIRANDIPHAERIIDETIKIINFINLQKKNRKLEEKLFDMNKDF